jgi:BirA family biotin operon repressor/biotin-[acetyl-CoA-carboxylase] ligase
VAAAIAVAETVEDAGVERAHLKWPNDVWVRDRKISGILAEARDAGGPDAAFVLGIGINVGQESFPDDLRVPATSLRMEIGLETEPGSIHARLLHRLEPWLDATLGGELAALDAAFSARDTLTGRRVELAVSRETIRGEVRRISVLDGLTVRTPDGTEITVPPDHVSEVAVLGPGATP